MDRGSKMALDVKGITKADLEDRFKTKDGSPHGMVKVLDRDWETNRTIYTVYFYSTWFFI